MRQCLQACRYVHGIAPKVATFNDELPEVDAHAELDSLVVRHFSVARGHPALHLNGSAHGVYDACEFHKHSIPDDPHYPPVKIP